MSDVSTPHDVLVALYDITVEDACRAIVAGVTVPPVCAGVVVSPHNPPEVHIYPVLDPTRHREMMRAAYRGEACDPGSTVYGLVFVCFGQLKNLDASDVGLLSVRCTPDDVWAEARPYIDTPIHGRAFLRAIPAPADVIAAYQDVFNAAVPLQSPRQVVSGQRSLRNILGLARSLPNE